MSKSCCIEDSDVSSGTSSCSMVLRSACSHRRSPKLTTAKESAASGHARRQSRSITAENTERSSSDNSTSDTSQFGSVLEPLKQHALKSAKKTYSILKESLYSSLELSESHSYKIYEASLLNSSCAKELHFSGLSLSNNSAFLNDSTLNKEECSDYSSGVESDLCKELFDNSTSKMSRSQRYGRSTLSSVRSLSESESEDNDISNRLRSRKSDSLNVGAKSSYTERQKVMPEARTNSHNISNHRSSSNNVYSVLNNHSHSHSGADSEVKEGHLPDLPALNVSAVQYSSLDRFRWFLWKYIYLMIIRTVNFDVWFLSRLHNWGKHKAAFIFLIPILLYLLSSMMSNDSNVLEMPVDLYTSISSVMMYFSSVLSSAVNYFMQKDDFVADATTEESSCYPIVSGVSTVFSSFSGISGIIANMFDRTKKSASFTYESDTDSVEPVSEPSKEEIRLVVAGVLKEEIKTVLKDFQVSVKHASASDKKEREKLQNELKNLHLEIQSLTGTLAGLEKKLQTHITQSSTTKNVDSLTAEYNKHRDLLSNKLKIIEQKFQVLESLKDCCDKKWSPSEFFASLETHLIAAFKNVMDGDTKTDSPYHFFYKWLNSKFIDHKKLSAEINMAYEKMKANNQKDEVTHDDMIKVVESIIHKHVSSLKANLSHLNYESDLGKEDYSIEQIKKIIKEAILLYDADKTGMVDYALESGGGSILGTRCSETYVEKYGKFTLFGLPIWPYYSSPRTAIQPEVHPGQCWAFKGSQGFLVIELSATIYPTGFTLEHIPVSLSPSGTIDSAPKDFDVWGLTSEKDTAGKMLGSYSYDINGEPLQYFPVQDLSKEPFAHIELKIHSNHGNMEYTCLYRFRVHGTRAK